MKKFLFILITIIALAANAADTVKTVYVDAPARIQVVKDSTFTFRIRGVDSDKVKYDIKNDTLYFRTNNSDLEKSIILITSPNPDNLVFTTSRNYEIRNY